MTKFGCSALFLKIFVVLSVFLCGVAKLLEDFAVNELQRCELALAENNTEPVKLRFFQGYIGYGYDYLLGKKTFPIFNHTFEDCRIMHDFLVLDYVTGTDGHGLKLDKTASMFKSIQELEASVGAEMGMEASGGFGPFKASASMSASMQMAAKSFSSSERFMTRTSMSYTGFTLAVRDSPGFGNEFLSHLEMIRDAHAPKMAQYLAEILIRDYGTHVIVKEDAGASVYMDSFYEKSVMESSAHAEAEFKAEAHVSALFVSGDAHINGNMKGDTSSSKTSASSSSQVKTIGGPDLQYLSSTEAQKHLTDHVVSLKQEGIYLISLINRGNLPHWSAKDVHRLQALLQGAIDELLRGNAKAGCRDVSATNFDPEANVDATGSKKCNYAKMAFQFGGVFQNCTAPDTNATGASPRNPAKMPYGASSWVHEWFITNKCEPMANQETGNYSCPLGYSADLVHTDERSGLNTFWCRGKSVTYPPDQGILYGGSFSPVQDNINAGGEAKCPPRFQKVTLFYNFHICFSSNVKMDSVNGVPFAGFTSCQTDYTCPKDFDKLAVAKVDECFIYACIMYTKNMNFAVARRVEPFQYVPLPHIQLEEVLNVTSVNGCEWRSPVVSVFAIVFLHFHTFLL